MHLAEAKPTHFDISLEVCYTLENILLHNFIILLVEQIPLKRILIKSLITNQTET